MSSAVYEDQDLSARQRRLLLLTTRETEPDWDKEIADDVKEECSKFGAVNHVYVDRNSKVRGVYKSASLPVCLQASAAPESPPICMCRDLST